MLDLSELQSRYVLGGLEKPRFIINVRGQLGNLIFVYSENISATISMIAGSICW
jgi:hypothetical protein